MFECFTYKSIYLLFLFKILIVFRLLSQWREKGEKDPWTSQLKY